MWKAIHCRRGQRRFSRFGAGSRQVSIGGAHAPRQRSGAHAACGRVPGTGGVPLLPVIYTNKVPGGGVICEDLIDNFRIDPANLDARGRMIGNTCVRTRDLLDLNRPK